MKIELVSSKVIRTLRHRRYYQSLVKKTDTIVSAARVAFGGAFRNQRGLDVGKVKVGTEYCGLRAGPVMHASAEEGGHVRFTCSIANYDKSTQVSWYFGKRQLHPSPKYEITYNKGFDSAYGELFVETVRSFREHYMSRTIKKLRRRVDRTKLLQRPPEFTLPLYNRTAYIGEDVRFGVTITVHPEPHVTWLKNGEQIKEEDGKYTFTSDKGLYQLMIHNLDISDDAEYTVMAHNRFGEDSCMARLTVVPRVYIFTNMSGVLSITILGCQEEDSGTYRCVCSNSKGEASDYAILEVSGGGYTTFSSRRRDEEAPKAVVPEVLRIDHYHTTHFKTGYTSQTHLEVEESKSKLTETREVVTRERIGASAERFSSAERYDSSIKYASTEYLSSSSSYSSEKFSLTGKHATSEDKLKLIEALPEDISIEPGKVLTVTCAFSGDAKHIEWSRAGKTIDVSTGGRFHIETTEDLTTLIITGVKEEDAGAYTLRLSNELGSDAATVHISIRSV
uniref:Ig-like domain-containing protein n=1 Tax=Fundulus heteroclitus TaxID=8078 RepID=A0A3Q2Q137_FUNHE